MKSPLLFAPILIELGFFAALCGQDAHVAPHPILTPAQRSAEIHELRNELDAISARLNVLESEGREFLPRGMGAIASDTSTAAAPTAATTPTAPANPAAPSAVSPASATVATTPQAPDTSALAFFHGTTLNVGIDGYYGYNFNQPIGRVNLLRAYDVSSNSFSLNQGNLIIEHLPTTTDRFGGRVDLQFGQATETLQGSSANEQRPQVWRNFFQTYGSYLAPIGSGLQIDFGKWASALGVEGNYTKDQIAYSRGFMFDYLPSYHMGLRASYTFTPKLQAAYWLVNGINDTEDLNGLKSQALILTLTPASTLSWNVNYYFGEEARDVNPTLNPGAPSSPAQPGLPTSNINPAPNGREHIFDTYATWNASPKLTLVGEADFVVNRAYTEQRPGRVAIGAFEFKYVLPRTWSLGGRAEYFDDRGGLFSGVTQALKEATLVLDHKFAPGFLARAEYRRDFSNQRFFLTDTADVFANAQSTAELGLVYWWGMKSGTW